MIIQDDRPSPRFSIFRCSISRLLVRFLGIGLFSLWFATDLLHMGCSSFVILYTVDRITSSSGLPSARQVSKEERLASIVARCAPVSFTMASTICSGLGLSKTGGMGCLCKHHMCIQIILCFCHSQNRIWLEIPATPPLGVLNAMTCIPKLHLLKISSPRMVAASEIQ